MVKKSNREILTFTGHYLPGVNGGGPIRTMASMVEALGDEFAFSLVTQDRDLGSPEPYPGIQPNLWQEVGKARVCYLAPDKLTWSFLRRLIAETPHDILYLNSFFSLHFGILPMIFRRLGLIPEKPTIMAPRGQFSSGALQLKAFKKKAYITFVKVLRLHSRMIWQVSSPHEKEDLLKVFPGNASAGAQLAITVAPNLPDIKPLNVQKSSSKEPGKLTIVFLSRVSPMKNLEGAIKLLDGLSGSVLFHIYGPVEDAAYWQKCQGLVKELPDNIQVRYQGMLAHDAVLSTLAEHDLFFLPTLGENYGHVIIEALAAGLPVLISDQTPWRDLEKKGVGWNVPLDQSERFKSILQECVDMGPKEFAPYAARALAYAEKKMTDETAVNQNRALFLNAI